MEELKGIEELRKELKMLSGMIETIAVRPVDKSVQLDISANEIQQLKERYRNPEAVRAAIANKVAGALIAELSPEIDISRVAKGFSAWGKYSTKLER